MEISAGGARALRRNSQVVRVLSGQGWITFDGKDTLLSGGQQVLVERGKNHAVISAMGDNPLVYEIE